MANKEILKKFYGQFIGAPKKNLFSEQPKQREQEKVEEHLAIFDVFPPIEEKKKRILEYNGRYLRNNKDDYWYNVVDS